jgi:hypothetical protein
MLEMWDIFSITLSGTGYQMVLHHCKLYSEALVGVESLSPWIGITKIKCLFAVSSLFSVTANCAVPILIMSLNYIQLAFQIVFNIC